MAYESTGPLEMADTLGMTNACNQSELGFSLKPPEWLRNVFSKAVAGATLKVNTPLGVQEIKLDDPNAAKEAVAAAKSQIARDYLLPTTAAPPVVFAQSNIPWVPIGIGVAVLAGLAMFAKGRR